MRVNNVIDESELEFYVDRSEPMIETCDIYATHGNPDGSEHHACLDQLFDG